MLGLQPHSQDTPISVAAPTLSILESERHQHRDAGPSRTRLGSDVRFEVPMPSMMNMGKLIIQLNAAMMFPGSLFLVYEGTAQHPLALPYRGDRN